MMLKKQNGKPTPTHTPLSACQLASSQLNQARNLFLKRGNKKKEEKNWHDFAISNQEQTTPGCKVCLKAISTKDCNMTKLFQHAHKISIIGFSEKKKNLDLISVQNWPALESHHQRKAGRASDCLRSKADVRCILIDDTHGTARGNAMVTTTTMITKPTITLISEVRGIKPSRHYPNRWLNTTLFSPAELSSSH